MVSGNRSFNSRNTERAFLLLITVVMAVLFYKLFTVLQRDFANVPQRLRDGTIMNLNEDKPGERIRTLLNKGFYFHDKRDVELVSSVVTNGRNKAAGIIDNIGELNKSKYNVSTEEAFRQGGEEFKKRVRVERSLIGFTDEDSSLYEEERRKPAPLPSVNNLAMGSGAINGEVLKAGEVYVPGVLVRLRLILAQDSLYSENVDDVDRKITVNSKGVRKVYALDSLNNRQLQSLTAYARTDQDGKFSFSGLPQNNAFAVLPLQPGYEFGRSQGVQKLEKIFHSLFTRHPIL